MTSILLPLKDGHVSLRSLDEQEEVLQFRAANPPFLLQLQSEFEQQDAIGDPDQYIEAQFDTWTQIVTGYMEGSTLNEPTVPGGLLSWGSFRDSNVGYMRLTSFEPLHIDVFAAELDTAFENLADTDSLVIDVRFNMGGSDSAGLLLASHFNTEERTLAFTKRAIKGNGDGYTENAEVYIEQAPGGGNNAMWCYLSVTPLSVPARSLQCPWRSCRM